jgi:predicted RNase H-like HicB family nuclease
LYKHTIIIRWSKDKEKYIATVPDLPSLRGLGDSQETALEKVKTAIYNLKRKGVS